VKNWPQRVVERVVEASAGRSVWIAYSGGVDSHVLLHLLATSGQFPAGQLHTIHIDHGLSEQSSHWAEHCQQIAADLAVDYHCTQVTVEGIAEHGLESAARQARYKAIANHVSSQDTVLTAQHQDDQAETLLLQLLRGAGPKGLAAMPVESQLADAQLLRPLLGVTQAQIIAYAEQYHLRWIEDPSNRDTQLNRNYLRHQVWPAVKKRWPQASEVLSRSAQHCADYDVLAYDLGMLDLETVIVEDETRQLSISSLMALSIERQRNAVRTALQQWDMPLPSQQVLQSLIDDVCLAEHDRMPMLSWAEVEVRRFQDKLYFDFPSCVWDGEISYMCSGPSPITLSDGRVVDWLKTDNMGITAAQFELGMRLSFRQGGESILLAGHVHHKSLKHLYQEWAVPPWERGRIPLLFQGDELLAVVGYGYSEQCVLSEDEQGWLPIIKTV
jgi:tRNA(Ile)-lysidine synthase